MKNIFTIRPKPDHTHVGTLREEGVAPKVSLNIFSRLAEIRGIRENKCPRKTRLYGIGQLYGIYRVGVVPKEYLISKTSI